MTFLYYTPIMKVLIIEDDIQLNKAISEYFKIKAFDVVRAIDGLEALDKIESGNFDFYIIDINIPHINGLEILKHIRAIDLDTPVIIITASVEIENLSTAFNYGCSEYMKKPFHLKELDIRVNNLFSLSAPKTITLSDELYYDLKSQEFFYKNNPIKLRHKEKRLCDLLIKNINNVVPSNVICDFVWEGEIKETYPVRQLLTGLRKKIPSGTIQTKTKEGYFIETEK